MLCLSGPAALAQAKYPNRPVQIIVPLPPGGAIDVFVRGLGKEFETRTGVERRGREPRRRQHHPRRQRLQERGAGRLHVLPADPQHGVDQSGDLPEALVRSAQGFRSRHQWLLRPADRDPQQERAGEDARRAGRLLQEESRQAQLRLDGAWRRLRISSWNG